MQDKTICLLLVCDFFLLVFHLLNPKIEKNKVDLLVMKENQEAIVADCEEFAVILLEAAPAYSSVRRPLEMLFKKTCETLNHPEL